MLFSFVCVESKAVCLGEQVTLCPVAAFLTWGDEETWWEFRHFLSLPVGQAWMLWVCGAFRRMGRELESKGTKRGARMCVFVWGLVREYITVQ